MLAAKFIVPLILATIVLVEHANAEGYELGARDINDRLIEQVKLSTKGEGRYAGPSGNLDETKIYASHGGQKITYLKVVDNNGNNCAKAIPINGGPGSTFVVMHFTAPAGCKMEFNIDLYAL